jgi:mRNA interferase MazF
VVIAQGDVWWAELSEARGAEPGFRRPVVVVQGDPLNRSRIAAVVCVAVTSNLKWGIAPGNVRLPAGQAGLPNDSVANVSQIVTLDRSIFSARVGRLPEALLQLVLAGIDVVLGR